MKEEQKTRTCDMNQSLTKHNLFNIVIPSAVACVIVCGLALGLSGCVVRESQQAIQASTVQAAYRPYNGPKFSLAVGNFDNRSNYMRGVFSDGTDRLGSQAKTILKTHLQQSNRFRVMDRENMSEIAKEAELSGANQKLIGAQIVITGDVTEFGRRTVGDQQAFGMIGSGKKQVAYSKVAINVVNVATGEIIHSAQGAGEFSLSSRDVMGWGTSAGYDSTLNGKVLNLAIQEAVDNLVVDMERGMWSPSTVAAPAAAPAPAAPAPAPQS